jgi:16S rRNA G527 N7-methylase RsmG
MRVYHEPAIPVPFSVSVDYNDHYNLTDIREAEKILTEQWLSSAQINTKLIEDLWQKLKIS